MDKKSFSLGRGIADVYTRGIPSGIEAEQHAELARNWTLPQGGTSRFPSLYVPFEAFAQRALGATLPNLGYEWVGRKDLLLGADLLITPSVVRQAGAIVASGLRGDTVIPQTTVSLAPAFVGESAPAPLTDLTTGQAGPMTPRRLTSQTVVSRQLIIQGGQMLETLLRNDLTRTFAMTADAMALFGRGAAFNEPLGILANPGSIVQPILPPDYYGAMAVARELVALEGVDMESFAFIVGPSVERLLRVTPKLAGAGDTDTWTAAGRIFSSPRVDVNRLFFGSWSNMVFGIFGDGFSLSVDPYSFAESTRVLITCNLFMDIAIRMDRAFGYSDIVNPFMERSPVKKANSK
jgi:hypothetical protein